MTLSNSVEELLEEAAAAIDGAFFVGHVLFFYILLIYMKRIPKTGYIAETIPQTGNLLNYMKRYPKLGDCRNRTQTEAHNTRPCL